MHKTNNKKIIIQYIDSLNEGGAEALASRYAILTNKLCNNGYESLLVINFPPKDTENYRLIAEENVKLISIYPENNLFYHMIAHFFDEHFTAIRLRHIIRKYKPVAIHTHLEVLHYLIRIKKHLKGIRLLYTCHNEPSMMLNRKGYRTKISELECAKTLIRDNNLCVIALHEEMKNKLDGMLNISSTIIYNGIDITEFRKTVIDKSSIRNKLNISENAFVIGHIGRMTESKNHMLILKIFKELTKKVPNAFLLLTGTGEKMSEVKQFLQNEGLMSSALILTNRSDVPEILRAMDVFVFPSLYEGLPLALIEAQISGLRCVVSDRIAKDAFISNILTTCSIDAPVEQWVNEITKEYDYSSETIVDTKNYDLKSQFNRLMDLYIS